MLSHRTIPTHNAGSGGSRSAQVKFRISEAAIDLFLADGFDNVSVEAVAAASNVSRRTVFRYFATKEEIPFPDHQERQAIQHSYLSAAQPHDEPISVVAEATRLILDDFLGHRGLVLKRYQLTQADPRVRDREIVENDRYIRNTRRFLLESDVAGPSAAPDIIANMFDAAHRSALANWVRSNGTTDAARELEANISWLLQTLRPHTSSSRAPSALASALPEELVLAVLPANSETFAFIEDLKRRL